MGKVIEKIKLTNFTDPSKSLEIDALIDTGATMLVLPQDVVEQLGLKKLQDTPVRYANNTTQIKSVYGIAILEIRGRVGYFDALAEVEGSQPLVGQIVLERLDLLVDPNKKVVMPNPNSPDAPMMESLSPVIIYPDH